MKLLSDFTIVVVSALSSFKCLDAVGWVTSSL